MRNSRAPLPLWRTRGACPRCGAQERTPCTYLQDGVGRHGPYTKGDPSRTVHYGRPPAPRSTYTLTIRRPNDETVQFRLDGVEIGSFNHDEYGWAGMNAAIDVAVAIAKVTGMTIEGVLA